MNIQEIGIDVGFSSTKARFNGGRRIFPSVVGRAITGEAGYTFASNGLAVRMGDEEYFTPIGNTALVYQRQATGRRDGSWVMSDAWMRLLCGALGQAITGDAAIRLVTGLPVDDWPTYHTSLKEKLDGSALRFQMKGHDEQAIEIKSIKIPAQPFGALFSVMFDAFGHSLDNEYTSTMGAVVDVGGHTTNVQTIDQLTTVGTMSGSRPLGLLHALDAATGDINHAWPRIGYTAHDTAEALICGNFNAGGEWQDIHRYTGRHLAEFVTAIVEYVDSIIPLADRIRWLLLTGGGVEAIGGLLKEQLSMRFGNVVLADDPRWANVEGYLRLARRATREGLW